MRLPAILTLLATLAFLLSPFFVTGFNGFSADQFPIPQKNAPVQPAGYAFSIWGVIYTWLLIGAVFGLWQRPEDAAWNAMRPALILSLAIGAGWIPVAQISVPIATVMIWAMLLLALLALHRAKGVDQLWMRTPLGLYAGWLTAASCVSIGLILAGYGVMAQTPAAVLSIILATAIALAMQGAHPETPSYGIAVIWALVGIIVANWATMNVTVLALSALAIALMALRLIWRKA